MEESNGVVAAYLPDGGTPAPVCLQPHGLRGGFLAVDGTDGSGKSTTLGNLARYLRQRGIAVETVKTPSPECRALPAFRFYAENPARALRGEVDLVAISLVCLGDRLITLRQQILPRLARGVWVLCDRYVYCTLAELMAADATAEDRLALGPLLSRFAAPDLAVLTTVPADEAIRRIRARPEESAMPIDRALFARTVDAFQTVAREQGLAVVPTTDGPEAALAALRPLLESLIATRAAPWPAAAERG
jgi:thymidylate kinase